MSQPIRNTENPFIAERRRNVQAVREYIEANHGVSHKKVVAVFGVYGLKEATVNDYLDKLSSAGFIQFDTKTQTYHVTGGTAR